MKVTRTQPPLTERPRVVREGKPEKYYIAYGPLTITKGYVGGWPRYLVNDGRTLVSIAYNTLDEAKKAADEYIATLPRRSVMGE